MTNTPNQLQAFAHSLPMNGRVVMKGLTLNCDFNSSVSLLNNILSAYAQQAATKIQTPRKRHITALL